MMDNGQPDQKRPRIGSWGGQPSRELPQLPPPPTAPFQHASPFPRPDSQAYRPGPQHPPYSGQRDTMIKRDPPSDEPQYRPPTTAPAPDHGAAAPVSERFHPHFDPAVPSYRPAYQPPQSPMAAPESYNQYNGFPTAPREPYPTISYSASSVAANAVKRKAQRAAQACDSCRTLKAKCDEGRPHCSSCHEKGTLCVYRDPPPKQVDKASAEILEVLLRMEARLTRVEDRLEARIPETELSSGRMVVPESVAASHLKQEAQEDVQLPQYELPQADSPTPPSAKLEPIRPSTPQPPRAIVRIEDLASAGDDDDDEEEAGEPVNPGQPTIPVNHTTGAARLLLVPAIEKLASGAMKKSKVKGHDKYPMIQEERRGVLRLFGRGEGLDRPPGYEKDPLVDYGSESTPSDTASDVPSPAWEEWGQVGGLTPVAEDNSPPAQRQHVIDSEGMPDFRRETVLRYVKSYEKHLNIMHPILVPRHLNALVETFMKSIPASYARPRKVETLTRAPGVSFVGGSRNPESPGQKRKRSPVTVAESPEVPSIWDHKPGHPFRTISTALVLLVMALGEICEYKKKIEDISYLQNDDQPISSPPPVRNGHPRSPAQTSPTLPSSAGLPSPQDGDWMHSRSRRTSLEGPPFFAKTQNSKAKNIDILPGLSYFALATDIIGNQLGGNSLQHVHANILAGLYHGQLGRVLESHAYIHNACRGLQVILRPKLERLQKMKKNGTMIPPRDNPIVFAFWTCLQLESDILAELPCPHSGILNFEEGMPAPNLQAAQDKDGIDGIVLESYSAQLYLRKHLNMLHNMFYNPQDAQGHKPNYIAMVKACEESLNQINIIAPNLKWDETSKNAKDMLGARLRAKFYGARVITYRHFVLRILNRFSKDSKSQSQIPTDLMSGFNISASSADAEVEPIVIQYAEECIKALIKSTEAFHGLGDPGSKRLIVTNIWGTAHAQWGNIMTLQGAFMDPILSRFVKEQELRELLVKTMSFLWLHAHQSSALYTDYKILAYTGRSTGLLPEKEAGGSANSSFSSQSSVNSV